MNAEPLPLDYVLPTIFFQSPKLRLQIVSSYWLVFILALPLWWATTSIERLALPAERVRSTASATEPLFPVDLIIELPRGETSHIDFSRLARQVGALLEQKKINHPAAWKGLETRVNTAHHAKAGESTYRVEIHSNSSFSADDCTSLWLTDRTLHVPGNSSRNDLASLSITVASALSGLLAPLSLSHQGRHLQERLVAGYAINYRLAFSLLNEDASTGNVVLGWDIGAAVTDYLSPVLSQLGGLHNFTIESQVQFHAPLAFDPPKFISSTEEHHYFLGEEELKMFINSADWTLASSVSEDPVLHFILFVPSASRRHLTVRTSTGTWSNAFIVPQWGGVVILDPSILDVMPKAQSLGGTRLSTTDLASFFNTFRSQLLTLLGVPSLPPSIAMASRSPGARLRQLSDWQLDALLRRRALENTQNSKEALSSIIKLVDQIENMPVGQDVKGDVQGALDAIEQVYLSASDSPQQTLQHSAQANALSSRAFFNPGMLALLYFPAEHKYAVYIPLFAPVSVPLVAAMLKELNRWRKGRAIKRKKID